MEKFKAFLRRKDIEISIKRYGIDALGAMAQGLFCSLLIGTIINTLGTQFHISFLTTAVATVNDTQYTVGSLASAMSGPAMAVAIGYALHCPPLVLFSLITVGFASNALGGAGGPLAVLFVAIFYVQWSIVRLGILEVAIVTNLLCYYLTLSTTGNLCMLIGLTASLFCLPGEKRLRNELHITKD